MAKWWLEDPPKEIPCPDCDGCGMVPDENGAYKVAVCANCNGHGKLAIVARTGNPLGAVSYSMDKKTVQNILHYVGVKRRRA